MTWGWGMHQSLVKSYDCATCSVFDKECPDKFYTEENRDCLDSMEWPFKFSFMLPLIGVFIILIPFFNLGTMFYEYFKERKK